MSGVKVWEMVHLVKGLSHSMRAVFELLEYTGEGECGNTHVQVLFGVCQPSSVTAVLGCTGGRNIQVP